jgi:LmbE family N-acetylglucosaminyl deacetylase
VEELAFPSVQGRPSLVLFLGAHCDDIEIGCGGTILRLREAHPNADLRWVILSSTEERRREARASAARFLGEEAAGRIVVQSFRDGFLPYRGGEVKDFFEAMKSELQPDLIFTHCRDDRHQDHRLVCELTWNTWRNHLILEYEVPKYDGDLGQPNAYVPLRAEQVERKVKTLLEAYPSRSIHEWFDEETLRGILRLRGVESNAPERYAEAFYARKLVLAV